MIRLCLIVSIVLAAQVANAEEHGLQYSMQQISHIVGNWQVQTEFLNEDGSIARAVDGSYQFSEIIPGRVVTGRSDIPALNQTAGIIFYVNEARGQIEMMSVGADGRPWLMVGPLGGETRTTAPFRTAAGESELRFTRYNVSANRFESKMEYTEDGGKTWLPGNHQVFVRTSN